MNMIICCIYFVENWIAWIQESDSMCTKSDFYIHLVEEIIDNTFYRVCRICVRRYLVDDQKTNKTPK